jgi:nicotinamide-nucleotide amidase
MKRFVIAFVLGALAIAIAEGMFGLGEEAPGIEPESGSRRSAQAEIMAIGDELLYGAVYDTNSFWIADQITRRGAFVRRIVCVRDDVADISEGVKDALSRKPRFLFMTGGLGHTEDDVTRAALSAATGRKIVGRPEVLEYIAKRRGVSVKDLPPHFAISTSSLEGSEVLSNPAGVSPVMILREGETEIIAIPGPPREVYACFEEHLAERVQQATGYHSHSRRVIIDMYESELTPVMMQVMREIPGTYIKALVGGYKAGVGMPTEVMAFGPTEEVCRKGCEDAIERLRQLSAEKGRKMLDAAPEARQSGGPGIAARGNGQRAGYGAPNPGGNPGSRPI